MRWPRVFRSPVSLSVIGYLVLMAAVGFGFQRQRDLSERNKANIARIDAESEARTRGLCELDNRATVKIRNVIEKYNNILLSAARREPPIETPAERARRERVTAAFERDVAVLVAEFREQDCDKVVEDVRR